MSRPFDYRRPSDIDRWITAGLLLTLAVVVAVGAAVIVPKWRLSRALRAEWQRCRAGVEQLRASRPAGYPIDDWESRCNWVQTACANVFYAPFDPTHSAQLLQVNNRIDDVLSSRVTANSLDLVWLEIGRSCDRGRLYTRKYASSYFAGTALAEGLGGLCGGAGQIVLRYGQF